MRLGKEESNYKKAGRRLSKLFKKWLFDYQPNLRNEVE
jgi:hypothetical protein